MKIKKIKAKNFKSYKKLDIELNSLNFIIGGNACGKSNYVSALKFFNDIVEYGVDDAILLQGGMKYLFNSNSDKKENELKIYYEVDFKEELDNIFNEWSSDRNIYFPILLKYTLHISRNQIGDGYKIKNEKIDIHFKKMKTNSSKEKKEMVDNSVNFEMSKMVDGKIIDNFEKIGISTDEYMPLRFMRAYINRNDTLLGSFFASYGIFYRFNTKIKIYNFDVNLLKSPSSIIARSELEEDGSNLVNVIQQLLKSKAEKEKLNRLIKTVLPFIDDINIENNVNKSVFFKVKESYNKNEFPSYMLSDGTVNILAVIIALYFQENNDIIVLEEPEKNIHPGLLSSLVNLLSDVSDNKQIFVTTHNPFIIKEANLNDIFLVSRNSEGISTISKPINDKKIKLFLDNDMGVEDLFVDGILK